MAKIYLGVSPGSVPVESLFSTALAPYKVNMLTLNHDNYKFL